jgi:pyruvate kinase
MKHRAKIVATIGPVSQDRDTLRQLIMAGMDVARLNFSHGTHADHLKVYQIVRELSDEMDLPITIMQDIQGPKIRVGEIEGGKVVLDKGQSLTLTTEEVIGNKERVSVDFPGLVSCVEPGSRILIDDGNLELTVLEKPDPVVGKEIKTRVQVGGELKPHKGVNLPGIKLDIPALTNKDVDDLAFGLKIGVDAIAISFVRSANDLILVRQMIDLHAPDRRPPMIIAKLERPEALDNLEAIVSEADGVMVARGDLGVEMSPETVPIAQKRIIELANCKTKIVITATQMLESMILQPRPTRAEASDVANAIFDGTDAVMLSGETAMGSYPVEAVKMMSAIVEEAESHIVEWGRQPTAEQATDDDSVALARAARELAHDRNVSAIAVFTLSGRNAHTIAKARPRVPILAFTPNAVTYSRLPLVWGVMPYLVPEVDTVEAMIAHVEAAMLLNSPTRRGQQIILMAGLPAGELTSVNFILLHTIGQRR